MGVTMIRRRGTHATVGIDNEDLQVQPLAIVSNSLVMEVIKHWIGVKCVKLEGLEQH